jgi:polar amino acid transport system substrate-binding protein
MLRAAVVGLVAVGMLGAGRSALAAEGTSAAASRSLRVLVPADETPEMFSFEAKGRPGFERELIEGFCRINGLALDVVRVKDFDQIIPLLQQGAGDVITGIVDTEARRQQVTFTSEVYPVRHMAVTRRPGPPARRLEELRAMRVGVIPGTSWEQAVIEAGVPKGQRVALRDADALLAALRRGEVEAVVMTVLDFAIAQRHDAELEGGVFVGKTTTAAFAVRQDDPGLLEALNGYLHGMQQARQSLMFKYLSEDALTLIAQARRE